jgi:hypothetical protein
MARSGFGTFRVVRTARVPGGELWRAEFYGPPAPRPADEPFVERRGVGWQHTEAWQYRELSSTCRSEEEARGLCWDYYETLVSQRGEPTKTWPFIRTG